MKYFILYWFDEEDLIIFSEVITTYDKQAVFKYAEDKMKNNTFDAYDFMIDEVLPKSI